MTVTLDMTDTSIGLYRHQTSGELFVLRWASAWEHGDCIGGKVIACYGPLDPSDQDALYADRALGVVRDDWKDTADFILSNQNGDEADDAAWANDQQWAMVQE